MEDKHSMGTCVDRLLVTGGGKLGDLHDSSFFLTWASFNILGYNIVICVTEGWLATLPLLIYSGTLTSSTEMTTKNVP